MTLIILGALAVVVAGIGALGAAVGSKPHNSTPPAAAVAAPATTTPSPTPSPTPTPPPRPPALLVSLLHKLSAAGSPCGYVNWSPANLPGALTLLAECNGVAPGDTTIVAFTTHAGALAYATSQRQGAAWPSAWVVGPKWVVATVASYAAKVQRAAGGTVLSTKKPPPPPPPPPHVVRSTDLIVFSVTGWGTPSIIYGTDTINDSPPGGQGPLGDGNLLPWSATLPASDTANALYIDVTAQLEGSGDITATVREVRTSYYSNGTSKVTSNTVLATAHASGGYNIANAEYVPGF